MVRLFLDKSKKIKQNNKTTTKNHGQWGKRLQFKGGSKDSEYQIGEVYNEAIYTVGALEIHAKPVLQNNVLKMKYWKIKIKSTFTMWEWKLWGNEN